MTDELKQLIEDAAKLLGAYVVAWKGSTTVAARIVGEETHLFGFNPLDPERGDLMKVAEAAELAIDFEYARVACPTCVTGVFNFDRGDYPSLALAILRAASAVLKAKEDIPQNEDDSPDDTWAGDDMMGSSS